MGKRQVTTARSIERNQWCVLCKSHFTECNRNVHEENVHCALSKYFCALCDNGIVKQNSDIAHLTAHVVSKHQIKSDPSNHVVTQDLTRFNNPILFANKPFSPHFDLNYPISGLLSRWIDDCRAYRVEISNTFSKFLTKFNVEVSSIAQSPLFLYFKLDKAILMKLDLTDDQSVFKSVLRVPFERRLCGSNYGPRA